MRFLSAVLCLTVLVNTMESSPVAPDGYEPPVGGRAVRGGIFDIPTQVTIGEPSNTNVPVPDGDIIPVDSPIKIAVGGRAVRGGIFDIPSQVTIGEPSNTNVPVPDGEITPVDSPIKIAVGGRAVRGGIFDIPSQVTIGEPSNTNVPVPNGDITKKKVKPITRPVDGSFKPAVGGRAV